jgi:hypothetical protein
MLNLGVPVEQPEARSAAMSSRPIPPKLNLPVGGASVTDAPASRGSAASPSPRPMPPKLNLEGLPGPRREIPPGAPSTSAASSARPIPPTFNLDGATGSVRPRAQLAPQHGPGYNPGSGERDTFGATAVGDGSHYNELGTAGAGEEPNGEPPEKRQRLCGKQRPQRRIDDSVLDSALDAGLEDDIIDELTRLSQERAEADDGMASSDGASSMAGSDFDEGDISCPESVESEAMTMEELAAQAEGYHWASYWAMSSSDWLWKA